MKKVSIIMLAYNKLKYSKITIESLYKYTSHIDFEFITVNDGSTDGTKEYFESLSHNKKINFENNKGGDVGFNTALAQAEGYYTVFINNDLILTPNWLDNLIKIMEWDSKIGIAVPACNSSSNLQIVPATYKNEEELIKFAHQYNISNHKKWDERLRLMLYVAIFRTEELKRFGGVDEIYSPGGFDDDDLTYRYRRAGYKLIFTRDTYVHHFGSVTIGDKYKEILIKNREIFIKKIGVDSWNANKVELEVLDIISNIDFLQNTSINLLGIGDKCGNTLLFAKNILKEKYDKAINLDYYSVSEEYLIDLKTICNNVYHGSLNQVVEKIKDKKYNLLYIDLIIDRISFMDKLLKDLKSICKEDDYIIFRYPIETKLGGFIKDCGCEKLYVFGANGVYVYLIKC